jgi:hypothetical protein
MHASPMPTIHTPRRSVRVRDALWEAAKAKAEREGETVTDVLVRALRDYVSKR